MPSTTKSSRHQRSRSAANSDFEVTPSRSTNSLLNVPNNRNSNNRRSYGLHTLKEEMTVDSLQDMINTLKTLPPIITPPGDNKLDKKASDENIFSSREAALAEAEAKLMGTFNKRDDNSNGYLKKRTSLQQLPVLNEHSDSFLLDSVNKRTSMNSKSLSLSLSNSNSDSLKSINRRSSRNFDDWRNSKDSFFFSFEIALCTYYYFRYCFVE